MDDASTSSSSVPGTGTSFVVLSVSIVGILATALLLLSYYLFLTRCGLLFFWRSSSGHHHHLHIVVAPQGPQSHSRGLHAAAIRRIPTFRYHHQQQGGGGRRSNDEDQEGSKSGDCAVCLADFRDGERLRLLPACCHAFHIDCIDAWLQATANCPLCRATVIVSVDPADETRCHDDDIVIEISSSPSPPAAEEEQPQQPTRSRRSLSMDSSTVYLALQRMMLHHQQDQDAKILSPAGASTSRSLRRAFFSFSHSRSATVLPL